MGELRDYEALSLERWRKAEQDRGTPPPVLYFGLNAPDDFLEAGMYLGYCDFKDVQQHAKITDEPLAGLYHSVVLHFVQLYDPEYFQSAYHDLRYNPHNRASWNPLASTHQYFVGLSVLAPYAQEPVRADYKIKGVGKKGQLILRLCIDEDPVIENSATNDELTSLNID